MRRPLIAALCLIAAIVCLAAFWGAGRRDRPLPPVLPAPEESTAGVATVEFLDVHQGDAILIRSPEGKTALVDAGPSNAIVGQLRGRGVASIDLVVVSHHHQDHYGGMAAVIRAFRPRAFLDADSPHVTANYLAVLRAVKEAGMVAIRAGPNKRTIDLGSVRLTVFPQAPGDAHEENNNSVGLRLDYGGFSCLLTGDAEAKERRWWSKAAPKLCADVDVLKLAHHGSRNGTDAAWLSLTDPSVAVASMAAGNEFGHPHAETLALLRARGIPLLRTDRDGPVLVRTDGRSFRVGPTTYPTHAGSVAKWGEAGEPGGLPGLAGGRAVGSVRINTGRTR